MLPERIPIAGLIILRDGQPGEPEVTLSPLRYHYQHRAELEVVVQAAPGRASALDILIAAIGTALETDRTLGGLAIGSNQKPRPPSICPSRARRH